LLVDSCTVGLGPDLPVVGQSAHGRHAQFARRANLPQPANIDRTPKSPAFSRASRSRKEGRFAVVTNVEAGCGGRFGDARRAAFWRTEKSCGPDAPMLASSFEGSFPAKRRWQKSPVTGESTKETVNTIAQGMPADCG
jgi:hypothetical protein